MIRILDFQRFLWFSHQNKNHPLGTFRRRAAEGILTSLGGKSSHAAIVSRGMGKSCIVGCAELKINYDNNLLDNPNILFDESWLYQKDSFFKVILKKIIPTSIINFLKKIKWKIDFEAILKTNFYQPTLYKYYSLYILL